MPVIKINPFAAFSIGICKKCKSKKVKIKTFKDKQFCDACWIPIWLEALKNKNNQSFEQQLKIKQSLIICGYKDENINNDILTKEILKYRKENSKND